MIELVRSRHAITMVIVAAAVGGLANIFVGVAFVIYDGTNLSSTHNLEIVGYWLGFVSTGIALVAVCYTVWEVFLARKWGRAWELSGAALATFLLVIGYLIIATEIPHYPESANILKAVGIGGWGIVVLVGAAKRALFEQGASIDVRQAGLRAAGAASLLVLAVGEALPNASITQKALAITADAFAVAGIGGLLIVISYARSQMIFSARSLSFVQIGLGIFVLASMSGIISSSIIYGSTSHSINTFRIGISTPIFIFAIGYLIIAWAAFKRLSELFESSRMSNGPQPQES